MADAAADQQQINLPSLAIILIISGLAIRYLFFSSSSSSSSPNNNSSSSTRLRRGGGTGTGTAGGGVDMRAREAAVERIQQMFPQVERRTVLWDLQRTGGNVAATTERILVGMLETPPVTFQPPPAPGNNNNNAAAAAAQAKPAPGPVHPDLITRYKLHDKVGASSSSGEGEGLGSTSAAVGGNGGSGKAWSSNREERQSLLQKRRDQMILDARRKMEAKIAAEKAAGGGS